MIQPFQDVGWTRMNLAVIVAAMFWWTIVFASRFPWNTYKAKGGNSSKDIIYFGINLFMLDVLHCLTCLETCLAILLRHKWQAKLQGLTFLTHKSRNIFVAWSITRSRIRFYFSSRFRKASTRFFAFTQRNIPLATGLAIAFSAVQPMKTSYLKIVRIASTPISRRLRDKKSCKM